MVGDPAISTCTVMTGSATSTISTAAITGDGTVSTATAV